MKKEKFIGIRISEDDYKVLASLGSNISKSIRRLIDEKRTNDRPESSEPKKSETINKL